MCILFSFYFSPVKISPDKKVLLREYVQGFQLQDYFFVIFSFVIVILYHQKLNREQERESYDRPELA